MTTRASERLSEKVRGLLRCSVTRGVLEFWERVEKEWEAIDASVCQDLISSMPRKMVAVIEAKGGNTKY